jgi:hypothetical protein
MPRRVLTLRIHPRRRGNALTLRGWQAAAFKQFGGDALTPWNALKAGEWPYASRADARLVKPGKWR